MSEKFDLKKFRKELLVLGKNYRMGGVTSPVHQKEARSRSRSRATEKIKSRGSSKSRKASNKRFESPLEDYEDFSDDINNRSMGREYRLTSSPERSGNHEISINLGNSYRTHQSSTSNQKTHEEAQSLGQSYRLSQPSKSPARIKSAKSKKRSGRSPAAKRMKYDESEDDENKKPYLLGKNYRNPGMHTSSPAARYGRKYRMESDMED